MKVIENKILPPKGYLAINLFGVLFVRKGNLDILDEFDVNHELIHTVQMKEMLYLFFYIWYITEWLIKLIKYKSGHTAYLNISFEREAYTHQNDLDYLKTRRLWTWRRFLLIV